MGVSEPQVGPGAVFVVIAPAPRKQDPAQAQIRSLAAMLQLRKDNRSPFVLMLGAGASMSSGVPPTQSILQQLVDQYGSDIAGGDLAARFDKLWKRSSRDERGMLLKPFLATLGLRPSPGYGALARLVQAGYFDLVVTFNFDDLVEQALEAAGFKDLKLVLRGETEREEIPRLIRKPPARFTLFKLHGSLHSTDTFLFTYEEMANYPLDIHSLVAEVTSRPIIVCGYAFNDLCVMKAFSSTGEAVYCVNPSGAPPNLRAILASRQSSERVIDGELGKFDSFFAALEEELQARQEAKPQRPKLNPFKFLDSYDVGDREWYFGRKRQIRRMLAQLDGEAGSRPGSLHLIGPEKVGKTSFVRAGLLSRLGEATYESIYLRCRPELERQLREEAAKRSGGEPAGEGVAGALAALAPQDPARRVVLVLDQFERVLQAHSRNDQGWQQLGPVFRTLCEHGLPWLTVIFVSVDAEGLYYKLIVKSRVDIEPVEVAPLPPRLIAAIVQRSARCSGFSFDPEVVREMAERVANSAQRFTLAHLQAICYLLVKNGWLDGDQYRQHVSRDLEAALDSAINASDFLNYVEDLPLREGRCLLRSLMKVVSEPSKQKIAGFLKERFADILQGSAYPEPL